MKTFGIKSLYPQIILLVFLAGFLVFAPKIWDIRPALSMPFALMLAQLFYAPVIKLSNNTLSIFTLFPFNRNINVQLSDIDKIVVEIKYTMRFVVHMKDGTVVSTICNRYAYDMKPLYRALQDTRIKIETQGVGTIDWV